jgi:pimeloyl-ACP methyl ester carboxylesterase
MGRQSFDSDGVRIAYIDEGQGEPILLIHGFASNAATNWIAPGWVSALSAAGRRAIPYMVRGMVGSGPIAKALEAPSIDDVTNDTARSFRAFAEQTGSDLKALAACMRGPREKITADELATIAVPTLVAVGSEDVIAGSGAELATLIKGAQFLDIPRRDHMKAVGDARFKQGMLDFLSKRP